MLRVALASFSRTPCPNYASVRITLFYSYLGYASLLHFIYLIWHLSECLDYATTYTSIRVYHTDIFSMFQIYILDSVPVVYKAPFGM